MLARIATPRPTARWQKNESFAVVIATTEKVSFLQAGYWDHDRRACGPRRTK
jgi:hypothetical protein